MKRWLAALAAILLAACARNPLLSQESYVFGTRVEVLVWLDHDVPEGKAREAVAEALREFDRLHRAYHAWQPSELTALNDAIAAGRPHEASAELAGFIAEAQRMAAASDRLFDPGIGRLVALWGFHDDAFAPRLPDPRQLDALVGARPSIADLKIAGRIVTSSNRAVALDFGGYLKGVALDRAAAILKSRGVNNALINIGGNVLALGAKGGTPWRVGIRHPRPEASGGAPLATLELRDGEAIGTSGDYQRFFELDGRRYSHLLDPRSGRPAEGTQAVTILVAGAGAGMLSDAGTKPLFIAGDGWRALAGRMGIERALRVDAAGRIEVTEAFGGRLKFEAGGLKSAP